jgi:DNA-binding SARP family transcriptional activator
MAASTPDVRLQLLGGLLLERGGRPVGGRAAQRRRLGLLTLLAASPGRTVARDRIIALLWPEASTGSARHLLTDAVYDLRQALGDAALRSRGDDLALDPLAVWCDVTQFDAALTCDDLEAACALYRGELACGLHLADAPEFAHWLDGARAGVRSAWRQAMARMAARSAAAGSARVAADTWLRLAMDDLADEEVVGEAMRTLRLSGRRGTALALAQQHEACMQADVGVAAAPLVLTLRAEILAEGSEVTADPVPQGALASGDGARESGAHRTWRWRAALTVGVLALGSVAVRRATIAPVATSTGAEGATRVAATPGPQELGERVWEQGRVREALEQFELAVARDTSHGLAWYRLSQASLASDLPTTLAARADSMLDVLAPGAPARERLLFTAWRAFRAGRAEAAEEQYRTLVMHYPDDAEGWLQLGETLFHYNPPRGRPLSEAREPFTRALHLRPDNWHARWHLALLDAHAGRTAAHRAQLQALAATRGLEPAQAAQLAILRESATGAAGQGRLLALAAGLDERWLFRTLWVTGTYQRNLEATETLARALADSRRSRHHRMLGLEVLLALQVGRDDWDGASQTVAALRGARNEPAIIVHALANAAIVPSERKPERFVRAALAAVEQWQPGTAWYEQRRLQWLGLLHHALGDSARALAAARALESRGGEGELIRAAVALDAGRLEEAAALLALQRELPWFGDAVGAPLVARSHERFLRARALALNGRGGEARAWLRSLEEYAPADLAYRGAILAFERQLPPRRTVASGVP